MDMKHRFFKIGAAPSSAIQPIAPAFAPPAPPTGSGAAPAPTPQAGPAGPLSMQNSAVAPGSTDAALQQQEINGTLEDQSMQINETTAELEQTKAEMQKQELETQALRQGAEIEKAQAQLQVDQMKQEAALEKARAKAEVDAAKIQKEVALAQQDLTNKENAPQATPGPSPALAEQASRARAAVQKIARIVKVGYAPYVPRVTTSNSIANSKVETPVQTKAETPATTRQATPAPKDDTGAVATTRTPLDKTINVGKYNIGGPDQVEQVKSGPFGMFTQTRAAPAKNTEQIPMGTLSWIPGVPQHINVSKDDHKRYLEGGDLYRQDDDAGWMTNAARSWNSGTQALFGGQRSFIAANKNLEAEAKRNKLRRAHGLSAEDTSWYRRIEDPINQYGNHFLSYFGNSSKNERDAAWNKYKATDEAREAFDADAARAGVDFSPAWDNFKANAIDGLGVGVAAGSAASGTAGLLPRAGGLIPQVTTRGGMQLLSNGASNPLVRGLNTSFLRTPVGLGTSHTLSGVAGMSRLPSSGSTSDTLASGQPSPTNPASTSVSTPSYTPSGGAGYGDLYDTVPTGPVDKGKSWAQNMQSAGYLNQNASRIAGHFNADDYGSAFKNFLFNQGIPLADGVSKFFGGPNIMPVAKIQATGLPFNGADTFAMLERMRANLGISPNYGQLGQPYATQGSDSNSILT